MSLGGALQIGRSALMANQTAIEIAGNNLANLSTVGYHRQDIVLAPAPSQEIETGVLVGRGVQVEQIVRQINEALEGRIRTASADSSGAQVSQDVLTQIQSLENELSGTDLSTHLSDFFNAWSNLANSPQDASLQSLVVQQGQTLANFIQDLRGGLTDLRTQTDQAIDQAATAANDLLTQIQNLNGQIASVNSSKGGADTLRDQRDSLLGQLSQYMDISTNELPSGAVDVFVGSLPVILNGQSRGLEVRRQSVDGQLQIDVVLSADGSVLKPTAGQLGALINSRQNDINPALDTLDQFSNQLIYQVNQVYSQGQGAHGFTSITSANRALDPAAALNDPAAGLGFTPQHGSFQVHVTQTSTGQSIASTINVTLDGIDPANQTTLQSLAAQLGAVGNVTASVTSDGRLKLGTASQDYEISFSDDTSGVLAALGINTIFTGKDATDIAVNDTVNSDPTLLAVGQGQVPGDNRNALALAGLGDQTLSALGGRSLTQIWSNHVADYAVRLSQATQSVSSASVVHDSLSAQQQSVSGVNSDEEAINLMSYQRAYQASARFLSVVDQMMNTLLTIGQ